MSVRDGPWVGGGQRMRDRRRERRGGRSGDGAVCEFGGVGGEGGMTGRCYTCFLFIMNGFIYVYEFNFFIFKH